MNEYEKHGALSLDDDDRDTLLLLEDQSVAPCRRLSWVHWAIHGVLVATNLIILLINVSGVQVPTAPYSPAQDAVSYETKTYNFSIFGENPFSGEPRPEQQVAWREMMRHEAVVVSADELRKLNRTSVEIPGEGYLSELSMFHQLHCLDYVRKYVYSDYYGIEEDPVTVRLHVSHCIDVLRQAIQCFGDTSMVTYSWRPDYRRPWPDFQITKQCRSHTALEAWSAARKPRYHEGRAQNPYFDERFDGQTPTGKEGATELVQGTRLNPKILVDLGQS